MAESLEQELLVEIESKTGYRFHCIDAIDPKERLAARAILPVLWTWIDRFNDRPNYRMAIYAPFASPEGRPYFQRLLACLKREVDPLARRFLKQVLLRMVTPGTAEQLWLAALDDLAFNRDFHLVLTMMKYAKMKESALRVALDFLVTIEHRELQGMVIEDYAESALDALSRARAPEIREWFTRQTSSRDPQLRALARRAVGLPFRLPAGYRTVTRECDLAREVYSTELDTKDLGVLVRTLESKFGIQVPEGMDSEEVSGMLAEDRWIVCKCQAEGNYRYSIWLRREDGTTVEVRVLRD